MTVITRKPMYPHILDYPSEDVRYVTCPEHLTGNLPPSMRITVALTRDGFCWDVHRDEWKRMYRNLATSVRRHGIRWYFYVHVELAKAFVPNPTNKPHVVFKDGDKAHLHIDNLEWSFMKSYLINKRFGKLTVLQESYVTSRNQTVLKCRCDCGKSYEVESQYLTRGIRRQCPQCSNVSKALRQVVHAMSKHPLYDTWSNMKSRCLDERSHNYNRYGARGITICDEWMDPEHGVKNFITWAEANGWYEGCGLSIDRRKNDEGYSPDNCRWATAKTQARNRSDNRMLSYGGVSMCVASWAEELKIPLGTLQARVHKGWSADRIVSTPYDPARCRNRK